MKTIEFKIEGMTCGGCSGGVVGTLKATKGINDAEVSHETKLAKVEYSDTQISENEIFEIIRNMNYKPSNI